MRKFIFLIFIIILLCVGCDTTPEVTYERCILAKSEQHLIPEVLNESFLFSWPKNIIIMDSLIIIHDPHAQSGAFHIFDKHSGANIISFGRKGHGPGEFIDINSVNYNYDNRSITVFDPNMKKVIIYDISNITAGVGTQFSEFTISNSPNFIKQVIKLGDSFIVKGNDDKMRYGICDVRNRYTNIYANYPSLSRDKEANWSLTDYAVKVRLSSDNRILVTGTYIGSVLEIFEIQENGFNPIAIRYFFEPQYNYAQGTVPRWVTTKKESIIGFQDIFISEKFIYGLIWGVERSKMENSRPYIIGFDFEGNPLRKFTFDDMLETFAIDNDETIFGVALNREGDYTFNKYVFNK